MPTELARIFRAELNAIRAELLAVEPALADTPWRAGVGRATDRRASS